MKANMDNVRSANVADVRAIATVQQRGWNSAYHGLIPDVALDKFSVSNAIANIEKVLATGADEILVAVDAQNTVCGYCSSTVARDGDLGPDTAEIVAIYVDPGVLRHGFGRALLSTACEHAVARGYSAIVLWVFRQNHAARRFYEALGFTPDGAEKTTLRWGGVPLDEVRYWRRIPASP